MAQPKFWSDNVLCAGVHQPERAKTLYCAVTIILEYYGVPSSSMHELGGVVTYTWKPLL